MVRSSPGHQVLEYILKKQELVRGIGLIRLWKGITGVEPLCSKATGCLHINALGTLIEESTVGYTQQSGLKRRQGGRKSQCPVRQ